MNLNVIRTITIKAKPEGVDATTASLNKLSTATAKVSEVSDTSAKRTLTVEKAYQRLQSRYDQEFRAQESLAKVQRTLDQARAQGLVTQSRASELMQAAIRHHNSGAQAATGHAAALQAVSAQASAFAGRLGPLGGVLASMGTAGLALAGALGVMAVAFTLASKAALEMANKAGDLRDFADTTGFTTTQLQAFQIAGQGVGRSAEQVTSGLERFATALEGIQKAQGQAYETMRDIDRGLTSQVVNANSASEAYDAYTKILAKADLAQRNLLSKQVGGKGGIGDSRLADAVKIAGGLDALTASLERQGTITDKQSKEWDDLGDSITKNLGLAKNAIVSTFAGEMLSVLNTAAKAVKSFSYAYNEMVDGFKGADWSTYPPVMFINFLASKANIVENTAREFSTLYEIWQKFKNKGNLPEAPQLPGGGADESGMIEGLRSLISEQQRLKNSILEEAKASEDMMSKLGGAATASQQYRNSQLQLDKAIVSTTNATERGVLQLAKKRLAESRNMEIEDQHIGVLGQLSSIEDAVTQKRNELTRATRDGVTVGEEQKKQLLEIAALQAAASKSSATVSALGDAATEAEKYAAAIDQLKVKLADTTLTQEQFNRAVAAANPLMKQMKDLGEQFGTSFVSGMLDGKSAMDSLVSGLNQVKNSLANSGVKDLIKGEFASGALQIGASFLIDLFTDNEEAKKKKAEAVATWEAMSDDFSDFLSEMAGALNGPFSDAIDAARDKLDSLAESALEAEDFTAIAQAQEAFNKYVTVQADRFRASFETLVSAYASGDDALVSTIDSVNSFTDAVRGFVGDTIEIVSQYSQADQQLLQPMIERARESARAYALALLSVEEETSDTAKQIAEFNGQAQALQPILVELGMSAEAAADAIKTKLTAALTDLAAELQGQLVSDINSALGAGWVNDITDLQTTYAQMAADAAALGVDAALVDQWLQAKAQAIINSEELVGDQFQFILNTFPQLTGAVTAFSQSIADAADDIAAEAQSLANRLFSATNDSSTLTGALAAFDRNAALERATVALENLPLLEQVLAAERLNIIQDFNQQAIEAEQDRIDEQKRILDDAKDYLRNFGQTIKQWLNNYLGGSSSPLSPQAALAKAQSDYQAQYALTQTASGQQLRDALDSITSYADTYLNAAKSYYGGTEPFGAISSSVTGQLSGLPSALSPEQLIVDAIQSQTVSLTATMDAWFNTLDTNTDGLLNQTEFIAGLHGMASDAVLAQMFKTLDTDNSGSLTKLEAAKLNLDAIKVSDASIASTNSTLLATVNAQTVQLLALAQISANTQSSATLLSNTQGKTEDIRLASVNNLPYLPYLQSIRNNQVQQNTNWVAPSAAGTPNSVLTNIGSYAHGGVIPPYGLALVSEHSPGGGRLMRAGHEPIMVTPHGPANDNGEIRALRDEVARLTEVVSRGFNRSVQVAGAVGMQQVEKLAGIEQSSKSQAKARRRVA